MGQGFAVTALSRSWKNEKKERSNVELFCTAGQSRPYFLMRCLAFSLEEKSQKKPGKNQRIHNLGIFVTKIDEKSHEKNKFFTREVSVSTGKKRPKISKNSDLCIKVGK